VTLLFFFRHHFKCKWKAGTGTCSLIEEVSNPS